MDLTIDQAALSRALRLVARVTPTKGILPIFQMVLLDAEQDRLTLGATDGELGLAITLASQVATPGRTAIPARLLNDFTSELPAEPVRLERDGDQQRVRLTCGRFVAHLATTDPDDFPTFPPPDEAGALDLDAARLRAAIARVVFAASRDEARPALTGILFDRSGDELTLAAADGFRLARACLPEAGSSAEPWLVPARAVGEFGRLLVDVEAARLIPTADGQGVYFVARETSLFTRLIADRFPDIQKVIPQDSRTRVTVETAVFRQAVRIAGLFGSGEARPVLLNATTSGLHLQARGDETGNAETDVSANLDGEPQAVVLNTRLLTDVLDAARSPQLELAWSSPQTPVVIREAGKPETSDLWVTMPLYDAALLHQAPEAAAAA
ncbi:MAG: DNA polymerase III subunit beta [Chloroflexi bacterium]|nr:DNA polymerase III subunit beta [Chloroflexota bacterium]